MFEMEKLMCFIPLSKLNCSLHVISWHFIHSSLKIMNNRVFTSSSGQLSAENNIKFSNLWLFEAFTKYFRGALLEYVVMFLSLRSFACRDIWTELRRHPYGHEIEEYWEINIHVPKCVFSMVSWEQERRS